MNIEIVGKQIASMRKEKGIKQEELAKFVGVSTQAVSKWENGGVPDTELLPKIADFFSVSIDYLFGRSITDYSDLQTALIKKIGDTPADEQMKLVFNYCWDMERALMPNRKYIDTESIEDYENGIDDNAQHYSSVMQNSGFTRMGIANRSQYFLIVPEPENTDKAYLDGIDYPSFFKDLSDEFFWNTCIFLTKRGYEKSFTPNLLVKNMNIELDKANEILRTLIKYRMVYFELVEMDDNLIEIYHFRPTPSFIALMIFAREIIATPEIFAYYCENRTVPYLK